MAKKDQAILSTSQIEEACEKASEVDGVADDSSNPTRRFLLTGLLAFPSLFLAACGSGFGGLSAKSKVVKSTFKKDKTGADAGRRDDGGGGDPGDQNTSDECSDLGFEQEIDLGNTEDLSLDPASASLIPRVLVYGDRSQGHPVTFVTHFF